ncbi:hypothetical protein EUX98_g7612 [Antrodiella citrinella]|uniref:Uncharacterized protein n=1 Tax=Antrodiella citrinella TaxID=2447956 RepID=A0A4S4MMS4_9APHY|nr:hypothetical protein EUX98_g7612 [Antrodiella citrinella]
MLPNRSPYINHTARFDTAEAYAKGNSEIEMHVFSHPSIVFLYLVISTKLFWGLRNGPNDGGLSRKHIIEGTQEALQRLQLDYVDILFAHRCDPTVPMEEIVRAFNFVIEKGWAFYWATSEWTALQIEEAHHVATKLGLIAPVAEQCMHNMISRERPEKEYEPLYKRYDLGTTVYSALAGGFLTGKYNSGIPEDSRFKIHPNIYGAKAASLTTAEGLKEIAKIKALTEIAENENLKALEVIPKLTPDILERIEQTLDNKPAPPPSKPQNLNMSDFNLVEPNGWEYDLQSLHNIPWYDRTWGVVFETFNEFLTFSWPVITVTDSVTGRAHIVTRLTTIGAFIKMIKTRFGETLPMVDNILRVRPFETSQRHLRTITDDGQYKKVYSSLPAIALAALKARVRAGDPAAIRELWESKDKTFFAIDFEWSERNASSCLEWGYAAARCGHLDGAIVFDRNGIWPPDPEPNYRRGHYIVTEYADKVHNKHRPNFPWAFGDSQQIPKSKVPQILQAILSSMTSPDIETIPNVLVLVGHGISGDIHMIEQMKIKLPHNVLVIDTSVYERVQFNSGVRGPMKDPSGQPRSKGSTLSLTNLLVSLGVDIQCQMHNSGNDAFMTLLALQLLLDPHRTKIPSTRGRPMQPNMVIPRTASRSPGPSIPMVSVSTSMPGMSIPAFSGMFSPVPHPGFHSPANVSPDPDIYRTSGYYSIMPPPGSMNERQRTGSGLSPRPGLLDDRRRTVSDQEVALRLGGLRLG